MEKTIISLETFYEMLSYAYSVEINGILYLVGEDTDTGLPYAADERNQQKQEFDIINSDIVVIDKYTLHFLSKDNCPTYIKFLDLMPINSILTKLTEERNVD